MPSPPPAPNFEPASTPGAAQTVAQTVAQVVGPNPGVHLEIKALILLVLMVTVVVASALYVMYARGVFESTQQLVLVAEDSEGVITGMDLTFSGFAIGRVRRIELAEDGKARIVVDVARKGSKWLRTSSVFTMERSVVGETKLRAFTGLLADPPLPEDAVRTVLRGDATAEVPRLVASIHSLVDNLDRMTQTDSSLNTSLDNVKAVSDGLKGQYGALGVALGGDDNAKKVMRSLDLTNTLLARADTRIFGKQGALDDLQGTAKEVQATVIELRLLLSNTQGSLKKVDAVLVEALGVAANAKSATTDLAPLRSQVEASLRQVDGLINEINRKWPFARDSQIKLP